MNKKKVSLFMQDFSGGGAEKMMVNLANEFANMEEIDFELFVVRYKGPYTELLNDNVKVYRAKADRVISSILELSRYLKKRQPAAVLTTLKHVNIAAILAKKLARVSTNIVIREACHLVYDKGAAPIQKLAYLSIPFFYPKADKIVAVSKGVEDSVNEKIKKAPEIHVLYNPVISQSILKLYDEPIDDPNFPMDEGTKVIISSGRLEYQKDYETLIRAFAKAKEKIGKVKLCILGKGSRLQDFKDLSQTLGIEEDVIFLGFQTNPYKYIKNSDLFVLSSRFEGSPNVLVEAMAAGIPVISTDCPSGPSEILDKGKIAPLLEIGDVNSMAEAIVEQLTYPRGVESGIQKTKRYYASEVAKDYLNVMLSD